MLLGVGQGQCHGKEHKTKSDWQNQFDSATNFGVKVLVKHENHGPERQGDGPGSDRTCYTPSHASHGD